MPKDSTVRVQRHRCMRHLLYSVRYPAVTINSSPLSLQYTPWLYRHKVPLGRYN